MHNRQKAFEREKEKGTLSNSYKNNSKVNFIVV